MPRLPKNSDMASRKTLIKNFIFQSAMTRTCRGRTHSSLGFAWATLLTSLSPCVSQVGCPRLILLEPFEQTRGSSSLVRCSDHVMVVVVELFASAAHELSQLGQRL